MSALLKNLGVFFGKPIPPAKTESLFLFMLIWG